MAKGFKTGGRKAGTPNAETVKERNELKMLLNEEGLNVPRELALSFKCADYERIDRLIKLMDFLFPKIHAKLNLDEDPNKDDMNFNFNLSGLIKGE